MTTWLLANVGNRDITVREGADLPREARALGEALLEQWSEYKDRIELPIFGKALEWVARTHGAVDRVVLFASNQPDSRFRQSDTGPLAEAIRKLLNESDVWKKTIRSGGIDVRLIEGNPADYDVVREFFRSQLASLDDGQANAVYAEVSGGTPAMVSMLLLNSIEQFGARLSPLYVSPSHAMPLSLNVGRRLLLDTVLNDLRDVLRIHQYQAAWGLVVKNGEFLREECRYFASVRAVIQYARQRFNFNFEEAQNALLGADRGLPRAWSEEIIAFADDLAKRNALWLLREEIFNAEIDFDNQAYKDAVSNVFAFREAYLRQLAILSGARLIENDRLLDPDWLTAEPALQRYLHEKNINTERSVTTFVFERIVGFRAKTDAHVSALSDGIQRIQKLSDIRNRATHNHSGVSERDVEAAYPGGADAILADMRTLYEQLAGHPVGLNPFRQVNELIDALLVEVT